MKERLEGACIGKCRSENGEADHRLVPGLADLIFDQEPRLGDRSENPPLRGAVHRRQDADQMIDRRLFGDMPLTGASALCRHAATPWRRAEGARRHTTLDGL